MNKEEIDKILEDAWNAEQKCDFEKAIDIYQNIVCEIEKFRDRSPGTDHDVLNQFIDDIKRYSDQLAKMVLMKKNQVSLLENFPNHLIKESSSDLEYISISHSNTLPPQVPFSTSNISHTSSSSSSFPSCSKKPSIPTVPFSTLHVSSKKSQKPFMVRKIGDGLETVHSSVKKVPRSIANKFKKVIVKSYDIAKKANSTLHITDTAQKIIEDEISSKGRALGLIASFILPLPPEKEENKEEEEEGDEEEDEEEKLEDEEKLQ